MEGKKNENRELVFGIIYDKEDVPHVIKLVMASIVSDHMLTWDILHTVREAPGGVIRRLVSAYGHSGSG